MLNTLHKYNKLMICRNRKLTNREIEDILNNGINTMKKQDDICPECGSDHFIEDYARGIILCRCGQVIDNIFDNGEERRNFEGGNENTNNGMMHNRLLPQSSLGTIMTAKGRLKKLHIWNAMPYKERSDNIMFKAIHSVCIVHKIVRRIEDDAKILCKRMSSTVHTSGKSIGRPIITRGFNRAGIVAGCLFIACRRNDDSRAVKEISFYFDISEKDVNKGIRSLLSILNGELIVEDIGTSKVIHFIQRKCDELHIKNKYTDIAKTIAINIDKLNIASNHTTFSLAAASIFMVANMYNLTSITKKSVSHAFCGLSDVTVGKTYNHIKNLGEILINNALVDVIRKEVMEQKNKRIISQEIYNQMVKFNTDTSKYIVKGYEINHTDTNVLAKHEQNADYSDAISVPNDSNSDDNIDNVFTDNNTDNVSIDNVSIDNESMDIINGNETCDNYNDFIFMVHSVKNTLKELKYINVPNKDAIEIFYIINTKMNIIKSYVDQWATEFWNHFYSTCKVTKNKVNQKQYGAINAYR